MSDILAEALPPRLSEAGDPSRMEPEMWGPRICPSDVGRGMWSLEDRAAQFFCSLSPQLCLPCA